MGNNTEQYRAAIGNYNNMQCYCNCRVNVHSKVGWAAPTQTCFLIWTCFMLLSWRIKFLRLKTSKMDMCTIKIFSLWCVAILLIINSGDVHPNPGPLNTFPPNTNLHCLLLNAQSLKALDKKDNKIQDLQNIAYTTNPHVISICETWLPSSFKDNDILNDKLYLIHRKDRGTLGGGVLTAITKQIYSKHRPELQSQDPNNNEILVVEARPNKHTTMFILSCYKSQAVDEHRFLDNLEQTLTNILKRDKSHLLIMGDFNFSELKWETLPMRNISGNSQRFLDMCDNFGLTQYNLNPSTAAGNILELILTNMPNQWSEIIAGYHPFKSDHYTLIFDILMKIEVAKTPSRLTYNFKRANYEGIRNELTNTNLLSGNDIQEGTTIVDSMWSTFKYNLLTIIHRYVPQVRITNPNSAPWIDHEVIKLSQKKKRAYNKAKRSKSTSKWEKFKKIRNAVKRLTETKYKAYIMDLAGNLSSNPRKFWTFLKSRTASKSTPTYITENGIDYTNSTIKANIFNKFFHSVFTSNDDKNVPTVHPTYDPNLSELSLIPGEVLKILKELDCSKATGPDGLPTKILKDFARELSVPICAIFNASLSHGLIPNDWKKANIIPVFKKGKKSSANNYRPISLLPIISKVLERCIYKRVISFLRDKITPAQFGFLANRSTDTQLLTVFSDIHKHYDKKEQIDVVYFDISKAFDSVPHKLLILKLTTFGISGKLLEWFANYLSNRYQRVVLDGACSDWLPVESGVPQGSILGPLEFILFNNDLPQALSPNTFIGIFADDTKIYRVIKTIRDCLTLQYDIDKITAWGKKWGMKFNANKCQVITISNQIPKLPFRYTMGGTELPKSDEVVDLGVIVQSDLQWRKYISQIASKGYQRIWLIIRTLGFHAPLNAKKVAYISLVRSVLEYASCIWNPITKELITQLERVQRKCTNLITNNPHRLNVNHKSYKQRLLDCKLLPLTFRREISDIVMFLKSLNGETGYHPMDYLSFQSTRDNLPTRNQSSGLRLNIPQTHYTNSAQFYPPRLARLWNALPLGLRDSVRHLADGMQIKRKLLTYYHHRLLTVFDPDNACTWVHACQCPRCRLA